MLLDSSGNTVVADYTPPTNGEVMAEASKKCKTCRGNGFYKTWIYTRSGPCENIGLLGQRMGPCAKVCRCEHDTQLKVPKVCQCAVRRWEKRHGKDIHTGKPKETHA